jgi:large subunit ribosomal protein L24
MKFKKGDNVEIILGKDRGKRGKILRVDLAKDKVIVEGLNLRIKHARPRREGEKGQRIEFSASMHISNIMVVDPKLNKRTRMGVKVLADKKKIRISRKTGEEIK